MWFAFKYLASPKKFFHLSTRLTPYLSISFFLLLTYGVIGGLFLTPADYQQGDAFRIIYVHVPCAFLSIFIYTIMALAAIANLTVRLKLASPVIRYSSKQGALFTLLALLTGSLWGKPMWGTWWIWDARLTSELILLFLYLGIILFQSAVSQKRTGDKALSILILVGFVDIPIIHYSVYWWNTLHQGSTLNLFSKSAIDNSMLYPLLAMIIAFFIYYALVLFTYLRHDLLALNANHHWLEE